MTTLNKPSQTEITPQFQHEIEQFLYSEARLLDERRFDEWFGLLADDLRYFMPTRYNRSHREAHLEIGTSSDVAHYNDTKVMIGQRIKRLKSGSAWSEEPPSRTRHLITNVQIRPTANPDEFEVDSYFLLYRSRLEHQLELFAGMRQDLLRRAATQSGWQLAQRTIILDQTVVMGANLGIFF